MNFLLGIIVLFFLYFALFFGIKTQNQSTKTVFVPRTSDPTPSPIPTLTPTPTIIPTIIPKVTPKPKTKTPTTTPNINLPVDHSLPSAGYKKLSVQTTDETFSVDIVSADMNSTKVIVDTASDSDCRDNCPTLPLSDYVARSGAYAGINGSYFCPAEYPQCQGKSNTFDTLLMNKNKNYFNSDNNVYSSVPAVIFVGNSARFVSQSSEWGRDTGVDAVLANHPLMILGGQLLFSGGDDAKQASRGNRSFVGTSESSVYIGVVRNASVAQSAKVLHTMGIQNALNLDNGGSTALWHGGYKVGPGRNIPNALLFIVK